MLVSAELPCYNHSIIACSHIYIVVLRPHPVRGESHNQCNANGEVATILFDLNQARKNYHLI